MENHRSMQIYRGNVKYEKVEEDLSKELYIYRNKKKKKIELSVVKLRIIWRIVAICKHVGEMQNAKRSEKMIRRKNVIWK